MFCRCEQLSQLYQASNRHYICDNCPEGLYGKVLNNFLENEFSTNSIKSTESAILLVNLKLHFRDYTKISSEKIADDCFAIWWNNTKDLTFKKKADLFLSNKNSTDWDFFKKFLEAETIGSSELSYLKSQLQKRTRAILFTKAYLINF